MTYELHHGDALAVLKELPTASVDALITDPPYTKEAFQFRYGYWPETHHVSPYAPTQTSQPKEPK